MKRLHFEKLNFDIILYVKVVLYRKVFALCHHAAASSTPRGPVILNKDVFWLDQNLVNYSVFSGPFFKMVIIYD